MGEGLKGRNFRILAQDLAGEKAVDITKAVKVTDDGIVIPGELLNRIGTIGNITPSYLAGFLY